MNVKIDDVVQFNEKHKWCGSLGIVNEIRVERIMVGVPIPQQGVAYIFCKEDELEYIGNAVLTERREEDAKD